MSEFNTLSPENHMAGSNFFLSGETIVVDRGFLASVASLLENYEAESSAKYANELWRVLSHKSKAEGVKFPLPSWKEQTAFEEWASTNRYEMHQYPLHYLFIDEKTNAARQGWKAAIAFVSQLQDEATSPQFREKADD